MKIRLILFYRKFDLTMRNNNEHKKRKGKEETDKIKRPNRNVRDLVTSSFKYFKWLRKHANTHIKCNNSDE